VDPLQAGDPGTIGRYRLLGRLGEGGMGRVYLGRTPEGTQAAVKVIRDELAGDTGFRHRFRREVSAATAVAGMFTARVLDADPDGEPPWLATQFVDGPSLREVVTSHGPLDEPSLHRLTLGLAEALSAIHAAGLVHRDLKPANVLLAADGARVIDFGIAHSSGATPLTGTGEMIGTPEYMSPEQVAGTGPPGAAGDVFSMGATLCFAATGRGPFAAGTGAAVLYRVLEAEPDLRGMPDAAADVARRCLAKDPARRPTAPQVATWLRGMAAPPPAPAGPRVSRAGRRRVLLVAGAAVGVVLLAGTTALAVAGGGRGDGPAVTPTPTPAVVSDVDPDGPEARYVRRLCEGGDLLVDISESTGSITATGDPTVARQEYLDATARTVSTLDVALVDYRYLRDEAPTPEVAAGFGLVIAEFTRARESLVAGRQVVEASDPLTADAYTDGVTRFGDATRNLAYAATLIQQIELPAAHQEAGAVEPACAD
jgi:hypothetical protein